MIQLFVNESRIKIELNDYKWPYANNKHIKKAFIVDSVMIKACTTFSINILKHNALDNMK